MKKRKTFIFTNKRNSNRAVMAVVLGTISLAAVGTVVFLAYRGRGEAAEDMPLQGCSRRSILWWGWHWDLRPCLTKNILSSFLCWVFCSTERRWSVWA